MKTCFQKLKNKYFLFNTILACAVFLAGSILLLGSNSLADGAANFDSLNSEEVPAVELSLPISIDGRIQFEGQFVSLFFVEAKNLG